MLNLNIFESLTFHCACLGKPKVKDEDNGDDLDQRIYKATREYKISILPITNNFDIDNLYPLTDHVELWNIFIIGNDKTYILASINDPHIVIPNSEKLPNHQGQNIMPDDLTSVLDSIWERTLQGKQLQFYMVWNAKLYFVNTYPFFNAKGRVIGAILFMRTFETYNNNKFTTLDGMLVPVRNSLDKSKQKGSLKVAYISEHRDMILIEIKKIVVIKCINFNSE